MNGTFYHRFRKFFGGLNLFPKNESLQDIDLYSRLQTTQVWYEKLKVATALPGIRPASQKTEKVIEESQINKFFDDQDKLFIAEQAPTVYEDYKYLFTNKYPKLNPLIESFIKKNKLKTYIPMTVDRLRAMAMDRQITIDFVNTYPTVDFYSLAAKHDKRLFKTLIYLSLYQTEENKMMLKVEGLKWLYKF